MRHIIPPIPQAVVSTFGFLKLFVSTSAILFKSIVAKDFKVSHIPASCQKILNDIDDLADKYGIEYYQGLKVILHHTDIVVITYLVKELRKRSIRVFTKDLREFLY